MRVREAVRRPGLTIGTDGTIQQAAAMMEKAGVGSLVVLDGSIPVGMVTDRDLVRRGMAKALAPEARVDGVMSSPLVSIGADQDLHDAYGVFHDNALRRLVVLDDDAVVGVLTVDDLLIDLTDQLSDIARPVTAETIFGQRDSGVPATS